MEIIRLGKIPIVKLRSTCEKCTTEFTFSESEAESKQFYELGRGEFFVVKCPLCKATCYGYK